MNPHEPIDSHELLSITVNMHVHGSAAVALRTLASHSAEISRLTFESTTSPSVALRDVTDLVIAQRCYPAINAEAAETCLIYRDPIASDMSLRKRSISFPFSKARLGR